MKRLLFFLSLSAVSVFINLSNLYCYLIKPSIDIVFGYPKLVIYLSIPVFTVATVFLLWTVKRETLLKSNYDKVMVLFHGAHLLLVIFIAIYFYTQANIVEIVIENLTDKTIEDIDVKARNGQKIKIEKVLSGNSISFICRCRKITYTDSIGLNMSISWDNKQRKRLILFGSNEPVMDELIKVKIINDTISYKSIQDEKFWKRNEVFSPLISNDDMNRLERRLK